MTILKTRQNAVDAVEILINTLSFPNPDPARELQLVTDTMRIAAFMVLDHTSRIRDMMGLPAAHKDRRTVVSDDYSVTYFIDDGQPILETVTPTDPTVMDEINQAVQQDINARTVKAKENHAERYGDGSGAWNCCAKGDSSKDDNPVEYKITKQRCQDNIMGVCSRCGGELEPLETVDNARRPTFWSGCPECFCFDNGVPQRVYDTAKILVKEEGYRPCSNTCYDNDSDDLKRHKINSQISGACRLVRDVLRIHANTAMDLERGDV